MKTKFFILFITLLAFTFSQAEIYVSSILGDNMVLQRKSEVKIWGTAKSNQKLSISTSWNNVLSNCTCNEKGEWLIKVKTTDAGGPYLITIASQKEEIMLKNIYLGEVWLCSGQSNMEIPIKGYEDTPVKGMNDFLVDADNKQIHLFTVARNSSNIPQNTCEGKWVIANAESVSNFSAVGYLFAKQLQRKLNIPIGIICSSWGGANIEAWMSKESIEKFPGTLARAQKLTLDQQKPMYLYNGMIYPIINYVIKGTIWYQGEANIGNYKEYVDLMSGLVSNWRSDFGIGNFPFYFVQIAPYSYDNSKDISSALLRDEQQKAGLTIPNTGMVSTIDIGEENNIHPSDKLTVSKRLSYWALSETYGVKGITYKTPSVKNVVVKDSTILISFDNTGEGLSSFGEKLDNFEIAGEDKIFHYADAIIINKHVKVWSSQVRVPIAVRYAFHNFPQGRGFLYNVAALPVPSFRTDDWGK